jgi:hypothetical protein
MTGKVIDSGANSSLLVLLPLALVIMIVFVAWPFILGIFVLGLGWKLWQTYQWQKLSGKIDPLFNQLIQAHQGCLTVLDLSMKTGLNAGTAKWYLERKADQYGAVKRLYEDKGVIYYFLTTSALGSIFDDSEPDSDIELAPATNLSSSSSDTVTITPKSEQRITRTTTTESKTSSSAQENSTPPIAETSQSEIKDTSQLSSTTKLTTAVNQPEINLENLSLNQGELAKRLEVHSSTIGKRKSDEDFGLWSQSRDPDGIPWQYVDAEKIFIPLQE